MTLNPVPAARAGARECTCDCGCRDRVPFCPAGLTDEQRAVLEPLLPAMLCDTELGGRPERHWRRTMIDAMFCIADSGCKWRSLPRDFPKWKTVHAMLARWNRDGVRADTADLLRASVRRTAGRYPEPPAAIIGSQSVHESAEGVVPAATSGSDSWKKVSGRKRHLLADTLGLLIAVVVTPASVLDRAALGDGRKGNGFQVVPRRWAVERTSAWISRRRRCARDYERLSGHHAAMVQLAAIIQMTRRAARTATTTTG